MRFEVPQYIEMEDKIFGPLSFKEFSYLIGGAGLSYIIYRFSPSVIIAIILIIPVLAFALALAFYRPNNKPFIEMVQSAVTFFFGNKLYIWKKENPLIVTGQQPPASDDYFQGSTSLPKVGENKLTDLSFTLSTQGKPNQVSESKEGIKLEI